MTKQEFILFVEKTLVELKLFAEAYAGRNLANVAQLEWSSIPKELVKGVDEIIESITDRVYLSDNRIYPCVDLAVVSIGDSGGLTVRAGIANYEPRPFQKGWNNRPGPFIYLFNQELIGPKVNPNSVEFRNMMIEKGLLHVE